MSDMKKAADDLIAMSSDVKEALRARAARDVLDRVTELPEEQYLDIAAIAAQICNMPIAAVSLIDETHTRFKALHTDAPPPFICLPREEVICNLLTKAPDDPLIIYDLEADGRVCGLPFVNGTYDYIKFYAGLALVTKEGHAIGTICVVDRMPRKLRKDQLAAMDRLRRIVMALLGC